MSTEFNDESLNLLFCVGFFPNFQSVVQRSFLKTIKITKRKWYENMQTKIGPSLQIVWEALAWRTSCNMAGGGGREVATAGDKASS